MTRSIHRKSLWTRLLSSYVVLVVLVSFAGFGYAAPQTGNTTAEASQESTAAVPTDVAVEEPAEEPLPTEDPKLAEKAAQPVEPPVAADAVAPGELAVTGGASATPLNVAAVPPKTTVAVTAVAPATTTSAQLTLEGYNQVAGTWTTGNLKERSEGDWVEHRLIIDNVNGSGTYVMPATTVLMDHYWDGPNAIFYDKTRSWSFVTMTGTPTNTNPSQPAGASSFVRTGQDFGVNGTWGVDAEQIGTSWASGTIQVPAGSYGVIYWQGHLALSAYWMQTAGIWGAGPWSPGSPSHTWLEITGVGAKKVPIPSVDLPGGTINGFKFNDLANRGTYDAGEPGLAGWAFHLTGGPEGWPLDLVATSDADGKFVFNNLPPGTYFLDEEMKTGWATAYSLPMTIVVTDGEAADVKIGNYAQDVTKTFELSFGENAQVGAPMGTTFFARFWIDGNAAPEPDVALTGTGGLYSGSVDLPYGTVIDKVEWWASSGGDYLLGTELPDETLEGDVTNAFDYDTFLAGRKWHDTDVDGEKDLAEPWLAGWTIELRRASDDSLYASDVTDAEGRYNFRDTLPGEYYVVEVLQAGWFQTHAPTGTVQVANGYDEEGLCFGNVEVLSDIDVTKSGPAMAHVGDTITYEITVTNSGMTALSNVVVSDPLFGGVIGTIPSMAAGASQTFYPQYTVLEADPDPLPNTVTASGLDLLGESKNDLASWSVDIIHPAIAVEKTVDPEIIAFGGAVLYTYRIENTGDVDLTDITLDDDILGSLSASLPKTSLAAGEVMLAYAPYDVTDDVTNVATVTGDDPLELEVSADDDASVDVRNPAISIVKSADPEMIYEGELVTYTYLITNTGDTDLWNLTLDDNILGDLTYLLPATFLPVGGQMTAQITVPVSADVTNVGTVSAMYGDLETQFYGGPITANSDASVDVIDPSLVVRKVADPTVILAGENVVYTYEVENTGDVTLTNVMLSDDHLGPITLDKTELDPGEIAHGTANADIMADTTNVADATGFDPLGRQVSARTTAFVDVVHPDIEIEKSVSPDVVAYEGTVEYTYVVRNTGDVALYDISVDDDILGHIDTIAFLDAGDSITLGPVSWFLDADTTNIVDAVGTDDWGHEVSDDDTAFVDVKSPQLSLTKTADPTLIHEDDMVTYTYVIDNPGDTTLWGITLVDDILGDLTGLLPADFLAAGDSMSVTVTQSVHDDVTNIADVKANYGTPDSDFGGELTDTDTASVDVIHPDMVVRKVADPTVILAGELVAYTYEVENTGDVPLTALQLSDDQLGPITLDKSELDPGEIAYGTASANIDVDTVNVATATAIDPLQMELQRTAEASVNVVHPEIQVFKSVDPSVVVYEGEVTYEYTVYNPGDVDLSDVSLVDDKLGTIAEGVSLPAGGSETFYRTAPLDTDTTNRVDAVGHDAFGHEVSAFATAEVDVIHPAVDIVKTADPLVITAGMDVTYTYVVTNTGDVPLEGLEVIDDKLGSVGTSPLLAPEDVWTFQVTAAIAEDTTNVATVTADYNVPTNSEVPVEGTVTDWDDAVVDVVAPAIDVVKTADKDFVIEPGEDVTYTYVVTNIGDVPLFGVVLEDDILGTVGATGSLAVGESMTFEATSFIAADTDNTVVATGTDEWGHEVSDSDVWSVIYEPLLPFPPDMSIIKNVDKTTVQPGGLVTYTLTYKNMEDPLVAPNAIARNFTITDDFDGRYASVVDAGGATVSGSTLTWAVPGPVGPGESGTLTYTMRIGSTMPTGTTNVDNVVVIKSPGDPNPDNDRDDARVQVPVAAEEEPFLPFTGGDMALLLGAILASVALGSALRRYGARVS